MGISKSWPRRIVDFEPGSSRSSLASRRTMRAAEAGDGVDGNGRGRYVYAISRDVDGPDIASTTGLGGSPLVVVSQEGLSAVVSDVDLDEFGEEGLRRNL